jgi:quercetin dioxygenase-like cupin family protein
MGFSSRRSVRTLAVVLALSAGVVFAGCSGSDSASTASSTTTSAAPATPGKPEVSTVLDKQAQTILDQLLQYPTGSQAQVSSAVLTLAPGVSTGLHKHDAPLYAYILEGTLTVSYEGGIVKEISAGSAILEAIGTPHNGENRTDKPVRILVVNIGAEGVANTVTL